MAPAYVMIRETLALGAVSGLVGRVVSAVGRVIMARLSVCCRQPANS